MGRNFAIAFEKGFKIFNPMLKKEIFVRLFQEEGYPAFFNQSVRERSRNVIKHFGSNVMEFLLFVNVNSYILPRFDKGLGLLYF